MVSALEDMKRVGVSRGYEAAVGAVKFRCVASERSSAEGESVGGVELEIDSRSWVSGSPRLLIASAIHAYCFGGQG